MSAPSIPTPSNCYGAWSARYYQSGEIVTGRDGRNYACDPNYFLYCSWTEFEPGTGSYPDYSGLAWNLLPTSCSVPPAPSPSVPTATSPPSKVLIPTALPPAPSDCPSVFADSRIYVAGELTSYGGVIYQCTTSNGRCFQSGYEPFSPLGKEAWKVIGTCSGNPAVTAPPASTTCPPFFDKFVRVYTTGDLASYGNVIYQCITSNGRCIQDGYEPWSPLGVEAWKVVGTCNVTRHLRQRKIE
ncbi:hypothetical protein HJC23_009447 [Cyclotella cryptica]|uniref:Uncharacterized protein n=1 Tax=Cyclotella cryptica TaxID=29204 RepID=A0ABD3Q273_9STRA